MYYQTPFQKQVSTHLHHLTNLPLYYCFKVLESFQWQYDVAKLWISRNGAQHIHDILQLHQLNKETEEASRMHNIVKDLLRGRPEYDWDDDDSLLMQESILLKEGLIYRFWIYLL